MVTNTSASLSPKKNSLLAHVSIFGECATLISSNSRWASFVRALKEVGICIVDLNSKEADVFIAVDHHYTNKSFIKEDSRVLRTILIAIEPPSVNPEQFLLENSQIYGRIVTIPSLLSFFPNPIEWNPGFVPNEMKSPSEISATLTTRQYRFGMLSSNKYSLIDSSLYAFRKLILREFNRNEIKVTVGGADWNRSLFWNCKEYFKATVLHLHFVNFRKLLKFIKILLVRSTHYTYIGRVEDGLAFLRECKFVICTESDVHDFSEKIFNVRLAGSIPLYLGSDIREFGIPANQFIAMPKNPKEFVIKAIEIERQLDLGMDVIGLADTDWMLNWKTETSFSDLASICKKILLDSENG
jgi:hypothetical protein